MDYSSLGKRIRDERVKLNLTQAELAEKVEVTTAYIGQIERGERKFSIETFVNICHALSVSADFLLRGNMVGNGTSLFSEINSLLENRDSKDVIMAIDILKSVFDRLDK